MGSLYQLVIRSETPDDYAAITKINDAAFGSDCESRLVMRLRNTAEFIPQLSMVASYQCRLIGYMLFYPVHVISGDIRHTVLALAPMAVLPEFQRKGIGSSLVREGLCQARDLGHLAVIVLGHAGYYPRFGFSPASRWNIYPPFDVSDDVFLAFELCEGSLRTISGTVEYPDAFKGV